LRETHKNKEGKEKKCTASRERGTKRQHLVEMEEGGTGEKNQVIDKNPVGEGDIAKKGQKGVKLTQWSC